MEASHRSPLEAMDNDVAAAKGAGGVDRALAFDWGVWVALGVAVVSVEGQVWEEPGSLSSRVQLATGPRTGSHTQG